MSKNHREKDYAGIHEPTGVRSTDERSTSDVRDEKTIDWIQAAEETILAIENNDTGPLRELVEAAKKRR